MSELKNAKPLDCDDGTTGLEFQFDKENTRYILSEWGCLFSVLTDYGIDASNIPGRVGGHIVEDFMDLMCELGYIAKSKGEKDD